MKLKWNIDIAPDSSPETIFKSFPSKSQSFSIRELLVVDYYQSPKNFTDIRFTTSEFLFYLEPVSQQSANVSRKCSIFYF